jgi:hypothetical protein
MKFKGFLSIVLIFLTTCVVGQVRYNSLKKSKNISELTFLLKNTKSKRKKQEIEHRIYNVKRDEMFVLAKNSQDTVLIQSYVTTYENPAFASELKGCTYSYLSVEDDISYFRSKKSCISNWKKVLKKDVTDTIEVHSFIKSFSKCEICSVARDTLYQRALRHYFKEILLADENMLPLDQLNKKITQYTANYNNEVHMKKIKEIQLYNSRLEQLINSEKTTRNVAEFIALDPFNPRVNQLNTPLRASCLELDKRILKTIKNLSVEKLMVYSDSIFSEDGKREFLNLIKSKGIKGNIIHSLGENKNTNHKFNPTDGYSTVWFYNYSEEPMIVQLAGAFLLEIIVEPNSKKVKTIKNGVYGIQLNAPIYGKNSNQVEEIIFRDGAIIKGISKNKKIISNHYEPVSTK